MYICVKLFSYDFILNFSLLFSLIFHSYLALLLDRHKQEM